METAAVKKVTSTAKADVPLKLLIDGKEAFPEIIRLCAQAQKTILVNMFIWRDDRIGNRLAQALLDAADRGVRVEIIKDLYGVVSELAEEKRGSFFHKNPPWRYRLMARVLDKTIRMSGKGKSWRQKPNALAEQLRRHPLVTLFADRATYDHRKFYVFDDEIVVLGGINIEDKELYCAVNGIVYHDFMVVIQGAAATAYFKQKISCGCQNTIIGPDPDYFVNVQAANGRYFAMRQQLSAFMAAARTELRIIMPYIGDRQIMRQLLALAAQGITIYLIIPQKANLGPDLNIKWANTLAKGGIHIGLTPFMCHAKMIIADRRRVTVGSTNLSRKDLDGLQELNLVTENTDFITRALNDFEQHWQGCSYDIPQNYSRLMAGLTGLIS